MKDILNRTLTLILVILLPIYLVGATWEIGADVLSWASHNWVIAATIVIVLYQSRRIQKLEQEVKWLWDEKQHGSKPLKQ